jgi:hypothetical protein
MPPTSAVAKSGSVAESLNWADSRAAMTIEHAQLWSFRR